MNDKPVPRYGIDPYLDWARGEGVPIYEDFGVDFFAIETARWDRYDAKGALVHVKGRGDFVTTYALELPPGGRAAPQQHLFEELVLVLEGHGSTTVEAPDGTAARPMAPEARITSASTVGLPRESMTSRPMMSTILLTERSPRKACSSRPSPARPHRPA